MARAEEQLRKAEEPRSCCHNAVNGQDYSCYSRHSFASTVLCSGKESFKRDRSKIEVYFTCTTGTVYSRQQTLCLGREPKRDTDATRSPSWREETGRGRCCVFTKNSLKFDHILQSCRAISHSQWPLAWFHRRQCHPCSYQKPRNHNLDRFSIVGIK